MIQLGLNLSRITYRRVSSSLATQDVLHDGFWGGVMPSYVAKPGEVASFHL